jgi:curli biogenesis system outer membrane secretion channel CsgG
MTIGPRETVTVPVPPGAPCSEDELASVSLERTSGVRCPRWVAASWDKGVLRVATCEKERCGPPLEWRRSIGPVPVPHMVKTSFRWPAWATWTVVTVGALAAATTALVASGVFEPAPTETHFLNGGVQIEARPWR